MKKSSKILGSIALSAALIMGTAAPAFADDPKTGDVTDGVTTYGGATQITASTYTSQLSVTIPLAIPIQFNTVGGDAQEPGDGVYYIKNNSSADITITQAQYEIPETARGNWVMGTSTELGTGKTPDAPADVAVGSYRVEIAPHEVIEKGTTDTKLTGLTPLKLEDCSGDTVKTAALGWGIRAGGQYGFHIDAYSSKLLKDISFNGDSANNGAIATISYTVKVGKDTDATKMGSSVIDDGYDKEVTGLSNLITRAGVKGSALTSWVSTFAAPGSAKYREGTSGAFNLTPDADKVYKVVKFEYSSNANATTGTEINAENVGDLESIAKGKTALVSLQVVE